MMQPPQGGPPQPQQPYPQPPGQYPQQPYPQQYPQGPVAYPPQYGAPNPGKRGPSKGLAVLKLLVGLCASGGFGIGMLIGSHGGIAAGALWGAFLGVGLFLLVTGGAGIAGKKLPLLASLSVIALGAAIGAGAGPPVSTAYWKAQEESKYNELLSNNSGYPSKWEWDYEYFDKIPADFQRPEARGQQKYAEVIADIKSSNLVNVRQHVYDIQVNHKGDPYYGEALDAAAGELKKRYDEVLEKLGKPGGETAGDGEYPVDEQLRAAFKDVLTDLARAPEADIYVAFNNKSTLEAPAGHEVNLRAEANYVKTEMGLYVPEPLVVIDPGAAFSPSYDNARRGAFMQSAGDAFRNVFDANLLTLKALEATDKRDGKFVLEVSSHIQRTDSYFHYTSGDGATKVLKGFAFSLLVNWELKLYGRDGKLMYEKQVTSSPGDQLYINSSPTDPNWAIYSILMDSAYYNYSREVVGSFGVPPPAKKDTFAYNSYGISGE